MALIKQGWTTPEKMNKSTWEDRTRTLNKSGYARYDERRSTMLGKTTKMFLDRYGGDLRKLREQADYKPSKQRKLLKEFKGIGDVGVDIFFREVQSLWDELYPFADERTRRNAASLGLPDETEQLIKLVKKKDFPRMAAALVRVKFEGNIDNLKDEASK
jgi:hypothetical protein